MNDKIITGRALNALAAVLHELRPDWQEPGILDGLARATDNPKCRDGWHLALAAVKASADLGNRTPRVIALDGQHWQERTKEPERKITMGTDAVICERCRRVKGPDGEHECRRAGDRPNMLARQEARLAATLARGQYEREMALREVLAGAAEQRARGECGHTNESAEITGCPTCVERAIS
jgi:hypothetical protein